MQRYLFVRIGWMEYYAGSLMGDEQPNRGGEFNETDLGHEVCNFRKHKDSLYGYFQPPAEDGSIKLDRIDPTLPNGPLWIEDVLVVFIATKPQGGQFIIGWYGHAKVFGGWQRPVWKEKEYSGIWPLLTAKFVDGVLLPLNERKHQIPGTGPNRFGERNIFYSYDENRQLRQHQWIVNALTWVNNYTGTNLLTT